MGPISACWLSGYFMGLFHKVYQKDQFPERNDAEQFLPLFHKLLFTLNSKQKFNTSNQLGTAAVLTKQTSHGLKTTLRAIASLIDDLLEESNLFVLTFRLQSYSLELRFSKYRQISGGRFLVSLLEVCNIEKILAVRSLLKEDINFWEENSRHLKTLFLKILCKIIFCCQQR